MSDNDERKALRAQLELFLNVLEKRCKQKLSTDHRKQLLTSMTDLVIKNPGMKNNLDSVRMMMIVGMTDPKKFENSMKDLLKIFKDKKLDVEQLLKMRPDQLKKFLKANLSDKDFKSLEKLLTEINKEVKLQFKKSGMKPSGEQQKDLDDPYVSLKNLLGVDPRFTGGHAFVVQQYQGNATGIVDQNPNNGFAPIDSVNKTSDNQFGDSLGLNAMALANYAMQDGSASAVQEQRQESEYKSPTPFKNKLTRDNQ